MPQHYVPRPHQQRREHATEEKLLTGDRQFVGNIFPGSGKTKAYLMMLERLREAEAVDAAVILTPRLNLARQVEHDWEELRRVLDGPRRGTIRYRPNEPPLLRDELDGSPTFGYATTYQSLMSRPKLHLDFLRGRRVGLVLDEAQMLGTGEDESTVSADVVEAYARQDGVCFVSIETGTPYRADGKEIVLCKYSDPDEKGLRYLLADVNAGYQEGIEFGYLRPFDFRLGDGEATREYADGSTESLVVSDLKKGLRWVLLHPGYWNPMIDAFVDEVRAVQSIDRRFCGLVGAIDQDHARAIEAYLRARHCGFKALIAVESESLAQRNLERFRAGGYDALITVAMAHVGYDHAPIMVVCMLNAFRALGWVTQFLGRGLRVVPGVPLGQQTLRGIAPPDPKGIKIFEWMRNESRLGIKARDARPGPVPGQPRLGVTTDANQTDWSGLGRSPEFDVSPEEYSALTPIIQRTPGMAAAPIGSVMHFLRNIGFDPRSTHATDGSPLPPPDGERKEQLTDDDWLKIERAKLQKRCQHFDTRLIEAGVIGAGQRGYTAGKLIAQFGTRANQASRGDIERRNVWLDTIWDPYVAGMERTAHAGAAAH